MKRCSKLFLSCLLLALSLAGRVSAQELKPLDWWGLWTGDWFGSYEDGVAFVHQKRYSGFKTNIVLIQVDDALTGVPAVKTALGEAQKAGVGVILMLHNIFYNGCADGRPNGGYGTDDYAEWNTKISNLATQIGSLKSAVVAFLVFDDMNPGAAFGCLVSDPGQPSPMLKSMQLLQQYFPTVKYRGHVWQIGSWATRGVHPDRDTWLEGSTILFPYSYWAGGKYGDAANPYCPHRRKFPRGNLPAQSNAYKTVKDLKDFLAFVNSTPNAGTPVLFIPTLHYLSTTPNPTLATAMGCTAETIWYNLRYLNASDPQGWTSQVKGFLPFQYNNNSVFTPVWTAIEGSSQLKRSAKAIGRQDWLYFYADLDFNDSHAQGYARWHHEECALDSNANVSNCADMGTYIPSLNGGAWRGSETFSLWWNNGGHPPHNRFRVASRTWVAPFAGTARVSGTFSDGEVCAGGDGIYVAIYKNNTRIWPTTSWGYIAEGGTSAASAVASVQAGDTVRFLIHRGPNTNTCDVTNVAPRIRFSW